VPLEQQKIAVLGFGTAGIGITNLLAQFMQEKGISEQEARHRFYALDRYGLVTEKGKDVRPEQRPYARKEQEVQSWTQPNREITLLDVMRHAKPSVLIGVSGQAGAFTEEAVREMARNTIRPVIFPLSNPTSKAEAVPADLLRWTEGRALVGTGSPFESVEVNGKPVHRPVGKRVVSTTVAAQLRQMLLGVTQAGGTGAALAIPGYDIAGKSGTANKVAPGANTYSKTLYASSFIGMAPAGNPKVVVAVIVDEPSKGAIFGAQVAGPAFRDIMGWTLGYLGVPPK